MNAKTIHRVKPMEKLTDWKNELEPLGLPSVIIMTSEIRKRDLTRTALYLN